MNKKKNVTRRSFLIGAGAVAVSASSIFSANSKLNPSYNRTLELERLPQKDKKRIESMLMSAIKSNNGKINERDMNSIRLKIKNIIKLHKS